MCAVTPFVCQPQLKDLPRDDSIGITCQTCARTWSQSVRDMVETQRLGAQFMDLLEFGTRCTDDDCKGAVTFAYTGKPEIKAYAAPVMTLPRAKPEYLPYPVKAVVKARPPVQPYNGPDYRVPQYALPMPMPRTVQPASLAGGR